jgi:DNA mismatch repair protein MutS
MSDTSSKMLSPMMQQWQTLKDAHPEALLLFRLGDFYEAFDRDAQILSEACDVILTHRQSIPMSGIPHHQLENYLARLMERQYVVAIAEQMEEASESKGLVRRAITEVISPATYHRDKHPPSGCYFACLCFWQTTFSLSVMDLTTGEFHVYSNSLADRIVDELAKYRPKELLISRNFEKKFPTLLSRLRELFNHRLAIGHESRFDLDGAKAALHEQFGAYSVFGSELEKQPAAMIACGAMVKYLKTDLEKKLHHIKKIRISKDGSWLKLDHATLHHLEIFKKGPNDHSLQSCLDHTLTPMGARLLEEYLCRPLIDPDQIHQRQKKVECLVYQGRFKQFQLLLEGMRDLKRLAKRAELDLIQPKEALSCLRTLRSALQLSELAITFNLIDQFPELKLAHALSNVIDYLERAFDEDSILQNGSVSLFKSGFDAALDRLYLFKAESVHYLDNYQKQLKERYGIKNLKVGFNRAFGYYIEVSKGQSHLVSEGVTRLQTLVNAERFISQELKEFALKMESLDSEIAMKEATLYRDVLQILKQHAPMMDALSDEIACLDVMVAFADLADTHQLVKPFVDTSQTLRIEGGKHPVLAFKNRAATVIPNDLIFEETTRMMIITGPNMAGKSTYIRQTALLVLLAQIGCFVPAKLMHVGIVEEIFSRIGASDDLSKGLSTFMVEMTETANILHYASSRSLIILDEIGRGTSTYDGIAIASSVARYLVRDEALSPRTLFATHYFELTGLSEESSCVKNFHVAVHEAGDSIIFLRKILPGVLDKSFGIHVAKLAGLPIEVIQEAEKVLSSLGKTSPMKAPDQSCHVDEPRPQDRLTKELAALDLSLLTPRQALELLYNWQELLK